MEEQCKQFEVPCYETARGGECVLEAFLRGLEAR